MLIKLYLEIGEKFNPAKSTEYSRETTIVYTYEYPIALTMDVTGQMSRPSVRCLPIVQFDLGCHVNTNIIFATSDMSLMLDHDHVRMRMNSYYRSKVSSLTCVYVSLSTYI